MHGQKINKGSKEYRDDDFFFQLWKLKILNTALKDLWLNIFRQAKLTMKSQ